MSPDKGKSRSGGSDSPHRSARKKTAPPLGRSATSWAVNFASASAQKAWEVAAADEPDMMAAERDRLRDRPLDRSVNPRRTGQLKGPLATQRINGVLLPQWQQEITSAGRVWYCVDSKARTIWVTAADLDHPKSTD